MGSPEKVVGKMVLRLDLHDDKGKQKAMKAVSSLLGVDSIAMDMKDKKMTVIGVVDPVVVVTKLRKSWRTEIISIGPAKEPKKEDKKEGPKKEESKKEQPSKKEQTKKEEGKKEEPKKEAKKDPSEQVADLVKMYRAYNPYMTSHHVVHSAEEDPNLCVIC